MTTPVNSDQTSLKNVRIERRGGFAGLHAGAERDYAALTAAQRAALDAVIASSNAAASPPAQPGADRFSYRIQLTHSDGQQRVIDVPEDALPSALEGLVKPTLP